jgi:hypothetical protein
MCRNGRGLGAGCPGHMCNAEVGAELLGRGGLAPAALISSYQSTVYHPVNYYVYLVVNKETTHELNNYYVYIRCLFSVLHTPQSTHHHCCCYCTKVLRYSALIYQFSCLFGNLLFFYDSLTYSPAVYRCANKRTFLA